MQEGSHLRVVRLLEPGHGYVLILLRREQEVGDARAMSRDMCQAPQVFDRHPCQCLGMECLVRDK